MHDGAVARGDPHGPHAAVGCEADTTRSCERRQVSSRFGAVARQNRNAANGRSGAEKHHHCTGRQHPD
jgi:hypothetical protein